MANNNVASWTAGTILFGGKELHSVSAGSTADATPVGIGGNMVDDAVGDGRYIVFWEKANPSIFQTVLESAYVSDDSRIIVMELTGSATGGDVQIQSRDASHGASDKLNADSFNKIVAGEFATGPLVGDSAQGVMFNSSGIFTYESNGATIATRINDDGVTLYGKALDLNPAGSYEPNVIVLDAGQPAAPNPKGYFGLHDDGGPNYFVTVTGYTHSAVWIHTQRAGTVSDSSIYLDAHSGNGYVLVNGTSGYHGFDKTASGYQVWNFPAVRGAVGEVLSVSAQSGTGADANNPYVDTLDWVAAGSGDITNVIAGTGLNGGATSGAATLTVDAAQTGITSLLATDIKIGEDDQTKIDFETADEIHFYAANVEQVYLADNIFGPQSDSDVDLGTTGVRWKDAFVDSLTVTNSVLHSTATASGSVPTASYGTFQYASAATGGNVLGFLSGQTNATPAAATERSSFWTMFSEGDATSNRLIFEPVVSWSSDSGYDNYSYIGWHNYVYSISGYYHNAGNGSASFPSFAFYGDSNTGFYWQESGRVGYSSDGTNEFYFDTGIYPATDSSGGTGGESLGAGSQAWHAIHGYTLYMYNAAATTGTDLIVTAAGQIAKKSSSIQYKDNVKELVYDSSKLDKLRPVSYDYKLDNAPDIGLIAEEVDEIYPELINYDKHGKAESIKYHGLSVMLLEEMKNLRKEIKELKEKS